MFHNVLSKIFLKKHTQYYGDACPILCVANDNKTLITRDRNGEYGIVQILSLQGIDQQNFSHDEKMALMASRAAKLGVQHPDISLVIHTHRKTSSLNTNIKDHGNAYANRIALSHKKALAQGYDLKNYIVFYTQAPKLHGHPLWIASEHYQLEKNKWDQHITRLSRYVGEFKKNVKEYAPTQLMFKEGKDDALLRFWAERINGGHSIAMGPYRDHLHRRLCVCETSIHEKEGQICYRYNNQKRFGAVLSLTAYPETSPHNMLGDLYHIDGHFNVVQHIFPLAQDEVKKSLERHANIMSNIPKSTYHLRVEQCIAAQEELGLKSIKFHEHSFQIHVYAKTQKELEETILSIQSELRTKGIELIQETFNLTACFWSQFPTYYEFAKGRSSYITTDNVAAFASFPASDIGLTKNPWGDEPITTFKSTSGSHYHLNFHAKPSSDARGHALIIGGAGKGKTTLIQYLLMNCLKYHGSNKETLRMMLFDSLNGCRVFTEAFGGTYIDSASSELQLNPMQLPPTARNKEFLVRFVSMLAGGVNEDEEKRLMQAINFGFKTPDEFRSFHSIANMLKPKGRHKDGTPSLYARIEKYLPDANNPNASKSNYGMKFNAPNDSLHFDSRIVGFDMTELLRSSHQSYASSMASESLLIPTAAYIFHAFSSYVEEHGCPHIAFIDELWKYLESEQFSFFITEAYKEWRKRNGVIVGAIQDPAAVLKSSAVDAIINNTEHFILFPQPNADRHEYQEVIGLNQTEFDWVRRGTQGAHQVMIKQNGGYSVILDIDLSFLGKDLLLFSSQKEHVDLATKWQTQESKLWIDHYLQEAKA